MDGLRVGQFGLELKSMRDAPTQNNFHKDFFAYNYDRQSAFYSEITGVNDFWFIACEKTSPYTIGVYQVSKETMMQGKAKFLQLLRMYKAYFKNNETKFDKQTF